MEIKTSEVSESINIAPKKHICIKCNYITTRESQYTRHIRTKKHLIRDKETILENVIDDESYKCNICNLMYKTNSGLWKHKKNCIAVEDEEKNEAKDVNKYEILNKEEIDMLIKNNIEINNYNKTLQTQLYELHKQLIDICRINMIEMCKNKIEETHTP
jgi:hypothetical protein